MKPPLVTITKDSHYYLVTFYEASNEAVDNWLAQVEQIHRLFQPQDYVSYKIVVRDKNFSLAYVMRASNASMRRNPHRPHTRTAVMYHTQDAPLMSVLDMFLRWLTNNPRDQVRLFDHDRSAEADEWLRWLDR
jgi:predicted RNA-binding protein with RPS1 domain